MAWNPQSSRTGTAEHKRWAARVKRNSGGLCEIRLPGCTGAFEQADHKVSVAEGGAEFDPANGQGACGPCHTKKTSGESSRARGAMYGRAKHPVERHPPLPRR